MMMAVVCRQGCKVAFCFQKQTASPVLDFDGGRGASGSFDKGAAGFGWISDTNSRKLKGKK